jgi:hypothetical protein
MGMGGGVTVTALEMFSFLRASNEALPSACGRDRVTGMRFVWLGVKDSHGSCRTELSNVWA